MSTVRGAVVGLWLGGVLLAQDPEAPASAPLFVRIAAAPTEVWQQAACDVTIEIGYARDWLRDAAVPLLQRALDVPFQVAVPWLEAPADGDGGEPAPRVEVLPPAAGTATLRGAVGSRVLPLAVAADETRFGRTFAVAALRVRWSSPTAGPVELAPVTVRFASATAFRETLLGGRQPADRHEGRVVSAPLALRVRELPPPPSGFTGAVGEFSITASTAQATVAVGASLRLAVVVRGEGDLTAFDGLEVRSPRGFHVQGVVDRSQPGERTFAVDLLALHAGLREVPALPFVAFSPRTGRYETLAAGPVPVTVTAAVGELPPAVGELVAAEAERLRVPKPWWPFAAIGGTLVVALGAWRYTAGLARRRRRVDAREAALATALGHSPELASSGFTGALATLVGESDFAGEATWTHLAARGVSLDQLALLRALHQRLDAARFGGVPPPAGEVLTAFAAARRTLGA